MTKPDNQVNPPAEPNTAPAEDEMQKTIDNTLQEIGAVQPTPPAAPPAVEKTAPSAGADTPQSK
jgi:hypothetical protein